MKTIVLFFKTSPLKRGELIVRVIGILILSGIFISGSIYLFAIDPRDIGSFSFSAIGILILGVGIRGINPKMFSGWFVQELPPDSDKF